MKETVCFSPIASTNTWSQLARLRGRNIYTSSLRLHLKYKSHIFLHNMPSLIESLDLSDKKMPSDVPLGLRRTQSDSVIALNRVRCRDASCRLWLGPLDVDFQNATLADSGCNLMRDRNFMCPICRTTHGEFELDKQCWTAGQPGKAEIWCITTVRIEQIAMDFSKLNAEFERIAIISEEDNIVRLTSPSIEVWIKNV